MNMANGDAWGHNMVEYVKKHWIIILAIFAIAIWVSDVRAGTKDRYTGSQATADKARMELLIRDSVQAIELDIAEIKGEIKLLRKELDLHEGE
jgi:hypothetical protein